MAHLHKIYDNDVHFKIDPNTRLFSNVGEVKSTISQGDHNSERITFEIPRTVDGHDMSLCDKVEIHYLNFNTSTRESVKDVYQVEDLQVSEEDENIVEFSWLLSGNATKHNGDLSFSISFKCLSGEEIVYKWNTLIYSKITVGESYNYSQTVAQLYADVLEKWKLELIEAGTLTDEDISSAVNDYMGRNPISLSSLEQDEQHRLVTDTEKEAWNNKSNFSGNYDDLTNKPTIPNEYTLPIAKPTTLGGVKPIAKTDEMTQEVGVDELGGLFTKEGGSSGMQEYTLMDITTTEEVNFIAEALTEEFITHWGNAKFIRIYAKLCRPSVYEGLKTSPVTGFGIYSNQNGTGGWFISLFPIKNSNDVGLGDIKLSVPMESYNDYTDYNCVIPVQDIYGPQGALWVCSPKNNSPSTYRSVLSGYKNVVTDNVNNKCVSLISTNPIGVGTKIVIKAIY